MNIHMINKFLSFERAENKTGIVSQQHLCERVLGFNKIWVNAIEFLKRRNNPTIKEISFCAIVLKCSMFKF